MYFYTADEMSIMTIQRYRSWGYIIKYDMIWDYNNQLISSDDSREGCAIK